MNRVWREGSKAEMWTNTSLMGGIKATIIGDIKGRYVGLGHDVFTPAVDAAVKPNALIDGEVAQSGKIALAWGSNESKEFNCTALGCVSTSEGHELPAFGGVRR